jgi:hypothetical protein
MNEGELTACLASPTSGLALLKTSLTGKEALVI